MIAAEYEAKANPSVHTTFRINGNTLAIKVLGGIASVERVQVGEFLRLLRELVPEKEGLYA